MKRPPIIRTWSDAIIADNFAGGGGASSGIDLRKDGTPASNPQRMGPILLDRRLEALEQVLAIQAECNAGARAAGRPLVDMLNAEEEGRIRELIEAGQWPDGWDGDEPIGDELLEKVFADGSVQPLLPMFGGKP